MHDTSARLVERVLPQASYRQWVLTVPFPLRLRIARDPGELAFPVVNDTEDLPAAGHLDALRNYCVVPILWTERAAARNSFSRGNRLRLAHARCRQSLSESNLRACARPRDTRSRE